ncbi:hypothetical protein BH09MYX1_BH09MYX1_14610 [soil metagenome]
MRQALLSFCLLAAACGGAAQTKSEAVVPTAASSPSAAPSAAITTAPSASTPPPVAAKSFCPPVGKIHFEGAGDGDSLEDPIRIVGATGEADGVDSEYACLDQAFGSRKHGAWKLLRQALAGKDGRNFDVMSIQLADGTKKQVVFDITEYFGKF